MPIVLKYKHIRLLIISFFLLFTLPCVANDDLSVSSPNNNIQFKISVKNGALYYAVTLKSITVVEDSPLKMELDSVDITTDIELGKVEKAQINENFPSRNYHSNAINYCNTASITLKHKKIQYFLETRVFNDGVGFRFVIPGDNTSRIPIEATIFRIPEKSTVWYHDLYWHYEGKHVKKDISEVPSGDWAAIPLTIKLPDGAGYASITEAALFGYSGMALRTDGNRGFQIKLGHDQPAGYPFAVDYKIEDAKRLAVPAKISGTVTTPWRIVMAGSDLNTLVNSDIIENLSPSPDKTLFPDGMKTDWIKPGRAVWNWLDGGERSVEGMKEFSKLAGQLGFEYNVVDAFWYRWTDEQIKDLVTFSKEQGVNIWLWRHGRNVKDREERRQLFKRCQDLGVVGLKLDAFSNESKEFVDLYQECLKDAAEFKLMLNIHGSNKPTGESRMWPNELTREGIRGLEYGNNTATLAVHNTTLPFTRFLAGHGDYTPVIFGERRKETSWTHQIASAVAFTSPLMIYAAHPKNILENPAVDLIKSIPSVWDETIVLPYSEIGEIAAIARRSGNTWFLAVLNGPTERTVQLPLSFLNKGSWYRATIACDRLLDPAAVKLERAFTRHSDTLPAIMRAGGGYLVRFVKE